MSEWAIVARSLSKRYMIEANHDGPNSGWRAKKEEFWALRDVSFSAAPGEIIGIVGRNGAGKSTLLKILARITEPSGGEAEIHGRVASLMEVGTGFHPELTGRENILLNGVILGMKRAEIARKMPDIIAFSEVQDFLDTPVKHYSSGMYLRLAFGVAAHLESDVLLVDEVLAVGDAGFQAKCLGKMSEVAHGGKTVLFVSHSMAAVTQLCDRAIFMENGTVRKAGPTSDTIREYLAAGASGSGGDLSVTDGRPGAGDARFNAFRIEDEQGEPTGTLASGLSARLVLAVRSARRMKNVRVSIAISSALNHRIATLDSSFFGEPLRELPENGELVCSIPRVHLAPGRYRLELMLEAEGVLQDRVSDAGHIDVEEGDFFGSGRPLGVGFQLALTDFGWHVRPAQTLAEMTS